MAKTHTKSPSNSTPGPEAASDLPPGVSRGLTAFSGQSWGISVDTPMDRCPMNLDLRVPREKALVIAATQVPDYQMDQNGKVVVRATRYFAYATEYPNETTGEIDQVRVSVLFDREGRIFKTTGIFAYNALRAAASLYSAAEWAAGIPFVITTRMTSNRRLAHDVRVLIDAEDAAGPPSEPRE